MNQSVQVPYKSSASSEYQSSSAAPPPEVSEYVEPADVEEYYDEYGPPIVSYYPPPWDYGYLYAWVPWPFWWGGFGFGGFFILNDFDRHDHNHRFSNHVRNANGTVSRVNAVTRATGTGVGTRTASTAAGAGRSTQTAAGAGRSTQGSRLSSSIARPSASAVMNRLAASRGANTAGASAASRNFASSGSSRNMGNTNGAARNSATANQIMNRLASTSHAQVMSPATVARGLRLRAGAVSAALRHRVRRSAVPEAMEGDSIVMEEARVAVATASAEVVPAASEEVVAACVVVVAAASMAAAAMEVAGTVKKRHLMKPPH